jgi:hypothetical protein
MKLKILKNIFINIKLTLHIVTYIIAIVIWTIFYPTIRYRFYKKKFKKDKDAFLYAPQIILCLWCLHIDKFYKINNINIY